MSTDDYRARFVERFGPDADEVLAGLGLDPDVDIAAHPWLCDLLDASSDLPLHTVPRSLGVRLRALIHEADGVDRPDSPPALPVAMARLQNDSRRERELVGVRGGGADNWTLLFRSDVADVVLGVAVVNPAALRISGQVLVHDGDQRQFAAELRSADSAAQVVHLQDAGDSLGRFSFDRVPTEQLQLVLSDGASDIVATLDLGDSAADRPADGSEEAAP